LKNFRERGGEREIGGGGHEEERWKNQKFEFLQ